MIRKHEFRIRGFVLSDSDILILFPLLFLSGIGIVMVYSASSALALRKFGTDYHFLIRQAVFVLTGLVLLFLCRQIPLKFLRSFTYPILGISLGLLIGVLIPGLGVSAGGAVRWLKFGTHTFQPAEFARFALVLYLAYSLDKKEERIRDFSIGFLPHVMILGVICLPILLQPDFGSAVILFAITWIMLFAGGVRIRHLFTSLLAVSLPIWFLVISTPYRMKRWISFLNPWEYAGDAGYQTIHSLMAFGSGGIWGAGVGKGYQKLFYLPEPHTDFIFSVLGEELGLVGVLAAILCYALIVRQGIVIARNTEDSFLSLLATGLTVSLGLQVCINMGVALALLPTKGLTLPFMSYGGTSMLVNMASVGILMNIGMSPYEK
ncbi:MAG: putative lipid II flippase FtsW [Desulfobacterales bacterium]